MSAKICRRLLAPVVLLALWEILPRFKIIDPILLPPVSQVLLRGKELFVKGFIFAYVWESVWRVLLGFSIAFTVAIPAGILLGLMPSLEEYFDMLIHLLRPLAPPAWIPLAILWFGIGNAPAVFIIFIGTVFAMLVGTLSATKAVDKRLIKAGLTLGATPSQAIFHIVLPYLAPAILAQMRIGLGLAWMCVIAAEMVAVRGGIGFMMIEARNLFRTEDILLGMMIVGTLGLGLDVLLRLLERRILKWRKGLEAYEFFETARGL
ncbi:MAG: ABC transporter permease [Anaerolineae bacterium]|nr:ABC transporter permease [Anaerolineae bacterium]MDW8101654.1 ABC transporter permease [Anaerolineae bacterium]